MSRRRPEPDTQDQSNGSLQVPVRHGCGNERVVRHAMNRDPLMRCCDCYHSVTISLSVEDSSKTMVLVLEKSWKIQDSAVSMAFVNIRERLEHETTATN